MPESNRILRFVLILVLVFAGSSMLLDLLGSVGPVELAVWFVALTLFAIVLFYRTFRRRGKR
ncbi:MAG: hypothetical protein AVDCRST_MAG25-1568 [uncultured Rubrobacteraceae bacterium]|uniref:Uncharacterized protein n=1 Tax=uncultured Rubrobacteraceae bacterium TaxID=349277 RepID=A0A6J4RHU1_9ACTN|nr:MAG: hypothetical protein AVDCRST_MAG25-1568 [uncultured Rubrobacteraceae bacterium]